VRTAIILHPTGERAKQQDREAQAQEVVRRPPPASVGDRLGVLAELTQAIELLADPGGVVVPADLGQPAVEAADLDVMAGRLEPTEQRADARRQFIGRRLPGLERTRDELGNDLGRDLRGELVGGERDPAASEAVGLLERKDRDREQVGDGCLLERSVDRYRAGKDARPQRRDVPRVEEVLHQVGRREDGVGHAARADRLLDLPLGAEER
jgi:hypothetical protein